MDNGGYVSGNGCTCREPDGIVCVDAWVPNIWSIAVSIPTITPSSVFLSVVPVHG